MKWLVVRQGKVVVEPDGDGFLVMFPEQYARYLDAGPSAWDDR